MNFSKWFNESEDYPGSPEWMARYQKAHQFGSVKLDLTNLPTGVVVGQEDRTWKRFISVEFTRNLSNKYDHKNVYIPWGKGQLYNKNQAIEIAMQIIQKNQNAYTSVAAFDRTKFSGHSIYTNETGRRYFS